MENAERKSITKSQLVKELSWKAGVAQIKVKELLAALAEIVRREAVNTFVLPGVCKLEVVPRAPRKIRNPRTGETLMLPERNGLRIVAARTVRTAACGTVTAIPLAEYEKLHKPPEPPAPPPQSVEEPKPVVEPQQPVEQQPVEGTGPILPSRPEPSQVEPSQPEPSQPEPSQIEPSALISFRCMRCHQEVEATGDMVGQEAECPTCGAAIKVPAVSEPGTIHGAKSAEEKPVETVPVVTVQEAESMDPSALKNRTIRINATVLGFDDVSIRMISFRCPHCQQEIEASNDLVGDTVACPHCQQPIKVPAESTPHTLHAPETSDRRMINAMKGRTMRIDLPDNF